MSQTTSPITMTQLRSSNPGDLETAQSRGNSERRFSSTWPNQGTKKGLLMALGIGVILMVLVISAAVLVSSNNDEVTPQSLTNDKGEKITMSDVLSGKYGQRPFNGTWISDDEIQHFSDYGDLVIYNVTSDTTKLIITARTFLEYLDGKRPFECKFSADREFVLVAYDAEKVYRHSSNAKYEIYDTVKKTFQPLIPDKANPDKRQLQIVEWAPVGNALAFVFGNNIYYKSAANLDTNVQLTKDGNHVIYHGITDWVYEEEMFGSSTAFWFSKSGTHLAYVTFNDTRVDLMPLIYYGEPGMFEFQYPVQESLSYPKSGRTNPTAVVTVLRLPTGEDEFSETDAVHFSKYPGVPKEHLIGSVVWATDKELLVSVFNRVQNQSRAFICDMAGSCEGVLSLQEPKGWIEVCTPQVSANGSDFLTISSQKQGKYSYQHILMFNRKGEKKAITSGDYSIQSIVSWDEANNRVFYTAPYYSSATKKTEPSQTHLYSISDTGSNPSAPTCLTCDLTNSNNEQCLNNAVELSKKSTYLVHSCNGPNVPEITVRKLQDSKKIRKPWVMNEEVRATVQLAAFPTTQNFDIPVGNGFTAKARIWLPSNFNASKKYPLFVDVYGGPGSAKISDRYVVDWSISLVSDHEIIYAAIDGRGSGHQSDDYMFQINRRLGTNEIEDQIVGAKWLINNLNYIDPNRTAIWGWSYGGYATAMVMGTDKGGVYKCGISVAPVTSWLFYDTIYTERYMGLPTMEDNYDAYNTSDVTHHIENFRNKKFFIVHGNADDNVHYQQSMILSRALERADILFRQQSYPDENHSLGGVRRHLYHSLEEFLFTECF